jgi:hypothetical protein
MVSWRFQTVHALSIVSPEFDDLLHASNHPGITAEVTLSDAGTVQVRSLLEFLQHFPTWGWIQ